MKLKNKKTGKIGTLIVDGAYKFVTNFAVEDDEMNRLGEYDSLAELNEEWEDYEEPKGSALDLMILTLINFIENEPDEDKVDLEDCKQMLEKLKAWKRLKDKGFRFVEGWLDNNDDFIIKAKLGHVGLIDQPDVHLLFGGEE